MHGACGTYGKGGQQVVLVVFRCTARAFSNTNDSAEQFTFSCKQVQICVIVSCIAPISAVKVVRGNALKVSYTGEGFLS